MSPSSLSWHHRNEWLFSTLLGVMCGFVLLVTGCNWLANATETGQQPMTQGAKPLDTGMSVNETLGRVFLSSKDAVPGLPHFSHSHLQAVPAIRLVLANKSLAKYHPSAWYVLGYIGTDEDVTRIETYVRENLNGNVTLEQSKSVTAAYHALGIMSRRGVQTAPALVDRLQNSYLKDPVNWRFSAVRDSDPAVHSRYYAIIGLLKGYAASGRKDVPARFETAIRELKQQGMPGEFLAFAPESFSWIAKNELAAEKMPVDSAVKASLSKWFNGDLNNPGPADPQAQPVVPSPPALQPFPRELPDDLSSFNIRDIPSVVHALANGQRLNAALRLAMEYQLHEAVPLMTRWFQMAPDRSTREAALQSLAAISSPESLPLLLEVWKDSTLSRDLRCKVAAALMRLGRPEPRNFLQSDYEAILKSLRAGDATSSLGYEVIEQVGDAEMLVYLRERLREELPGKAQNNLRSLISSIEIRLMPTNEVLAIARSNRLTHKNMPRRFDALVALGSRGDWSMTMQVEALPDWVLGDTDDRHLQQVNEAWKAAKREVLMRMRQRTWRESPEGPRILVEIERVLREASLGLAAENEPPPETLRDPRLLEEARSEFEAIPASISGRSNSRAIDQASR